MFENIEELDSEVANKIEDAYCMIISQAIQPFLGKHVAVVDGSDRFTGEILDGAHDPETGMHFEVRWLDRLGTSHTRWISAANLRDWSNA